MVEMRHEPDFQGDVLPWNRYVITNSICAPAVRENRSRV